jgi:predicted RNA-binding Zn-ribbon protein involved in translation (DUF1610 family)
MTHRTCINCETEWQSLADHELDAPHTCPRCGDQLVADNVTVLRPAGASTSSPAAVSHLAA